MSTDPAVRVFINYRRRDTRHVAGRLRDQIVARFGDASVFVDVESILPGQDYVAAIDGAVSSCDYLLVLIGEEWLTADERGVRRIDDPNDRLRLEIESGLRHRTQVIPVLVDAARMPRSKELPASLVPLSRHQAVRLRHDSFPGDVRYLLDALDPAAAQPPPGAPSEPPVPDSRASGREPLRWFAVAALVATLAAVLVLLPGAADAVAASRSLSDTSLGALVWLLPAVPVGVAALLMAGHAGRGIALGCVLGALLWVWITAAFVVDDGEPAAPHLLVAVLLLASGVAVVAAAPALRSPVRGNAAGPALLTLVLLAVSVVGRGGSRLVAAAVTGEAPGSDVVTSPGFLPAVLIPVLVALPVVLLRLSPVQGHVLLAAAWLQVVYPLVLRGVMATSIDDGTEVFFAVDAVVYLAASYCLVLAVRAGERTASRPAAAVR